MNMRFFLSCALGVSLLAACSSLTTRTMGYAWNQWQQGPKQVAIDLAEDELNRYVRGNDLSLSDIETTASIATRQLSETPILDIRASKQPNPVELLQRGPSSLTKALRQDLGSDDALRVMRALQTVQSLGLKEHALSVFAIIYRRQPFNDPETFFREASPALRSVSVKWTAHQTLRSFLSTGAGADL